MKKKFIVEVWERRRVRFEVEAESYREASVVAVDVYQNDDSLQDEMLKDTAIADNEAIVVAEVGIATGIINEPSTSS